MVAIVYKTDGPWGTGKGANLVEAEVDNNFYGLDQRINTLETTPPQPVSIDHFVIQGTLLTIVLTNGVEQGPFVLPIGQWRFTGDWMPLTQYFVGDIFYESDAMYFVRVQHISEATFDPDLFGPDGNVYELIFPAPKPGGDGVYEISMYYDGPLTGLADPPIIYRKIVGQAINIPEDFAGSFATLNTPPSTNEISFVIALTGTPVMSVTFAVGAQIGVFEAGHPAFALDPGSTVDVWSVDPDFSDPAAKGLSITIMASIPPT